MGVRLPSSNRSDRSTRHEAIHGRIVQPYFCLSTPWYCEWDHPCLRRYGLILPLLGIYVLSNLSVRNSNSNVHYCDYHYLRCSLSSCKSGQQKGSGTDPQGYCCLIRLNRDKLLEGNVSKGKNDFKIAEPTIMGNIIHHKVY